MNKTIVIIVVILLIGCKNKEKKIVKNNNLKIDSTFLKKEIKDTILVYSKGYTYDRLDGTKFSFEEVKGKVLLLDFWKTTCAPCISQHSRVVSLNKKISSKNFQIVYISLDSNTKKWKDFIEKNNWKGIHLNLSNSKKKTPLHKMAFKPLVVSKNYKNFSVLIKKGDTITPREIRYVERVPTYYLVDKNRTVVEVKNINKRGLVKKIVHLINNK